MSFVHISTVSSYSFQYGIATPEELVARASEMRMPILGVSDRDGFAGGVRFLQACQSAGVAPVVGTSLLVHQENSEKKSTPMKAGTALLPNWPRITLLARHDWSGLSRLLSTIYARGLMVSPRRIPAVTHEVLCEISGAYPDRISLLLGGDSDVGRALLAQQPDVALTRLRRWQEVSSDITFEITNHLHQDGIYSTDGAARLLAFAQENNINSILSNRVRMLEPVDAPVSDVLDAARQLVPLHHRHVERRNAEAYFKSTKDMEVLADEIDRMESRSLLRRTRDFAENHILNPRDYLGGIYLPEPPIVGAENQSDAERILRQRCESGLNWRYGSESKLARAKFRLEEELAVIHQLGYVTYFLTVADIADMARSRGIRVAARGSGAGSLVCYLLGIAGIDPIDNGLLMERFCSPLRKELPDIDIDVESARRLEIYDAVFARYAPGNSWPMGGARTAAVAMVEKYRARHAIRDVGAALGHSPNEIDYVAKSFPRISARNINHAMNELPELRERNLPKVIGQHRLKHWLDLAQRLDRLPRNLALHPCAVVLSDGSLLDRAPTEVSAQGYPMVLFDKDDVEALGLLKLDILGVRMQSAMSHAVGEIERSQARRIDLDELPLDDPQTYSLIQSTKTLGIFQVESPGQRELVGKFGPQNFVDLMIDISLFRPGPVKSDMINPFLRARHGWDMPQLIHPDLEEVLRETAGVVVFHEQVMRVIAIIAGISLAEADEVRRALGKPDQIDYLTHWFHGSAKSRGYSDDVINQVWQVLIAFASFGFCKAHAAAFALPTYQSAWLKTHYPAAFIAGLLTHDPGMYPKRLILEEARQLGVEILPIDINDSDHEYRVVMHRGEPALRLSFADINGISTNEIDAIVSARPFLDIGDVFKRTSIAKTTIEKLVMVGAFDSLYGIEISHTNRLLRGKNPKINRRDLLIHINEIAQWKTKISSDQLSLDLPTPEILHYGLREITLTERVRSEMEILGIDVSCHVIDFYRDFMQAHNVVLAKDLLMQRSGSEVLIAGIKVATQTPPIRSGKRVIFLTLDDGTGCADVTFFEDAQGAHARTLFDSWLLLVSGVIRRTGERGVSLRATGCWNLMERYEQWRGEPVLQLNPRKLWHSST
jgi:error-prone DNA polymerase